MEITARLNKWRLAGASIRGASHLLHNKPNQDFLDLYPPVNNGYPYLVVMSDGHGSKKSFRSDVGSRSAVKITMDLLRSFLSDVAGKETNGILAEISDQLLPKLLMQWKADVIQHLNQFPVSQDERLAFKDGTQPELDISGIIEKSPLTIYGATLLAVAITETHTILLRIGDGDILGVDSDGITTQVLPKDKNLLGVETTSLCEIDAINKFKSMVISRADYDPIMILISTDGYSTSFETPEGFFAIGKDYLSLFRNYGVQFAKEQLPKYLNEASKKGSGDDISLGILKRAEINEIDTVLEVARDAAKIEVGFVTETLSRIGNALERAENKAAELSNNLLSTQSSKDMLQRKVDLMEQQLSDLRKKEESTSMEITSQVSDTGKQMQDLQINLVSLESKIGKLQGSLEEHKAATSRQIQKISKSALVQLVALVLLTLISLLFVIPYVRLFLR